MFSRSVIPGVCAGMLILSNAVAADLPMAKSDAAEYVKVCAPFGPGFFYIPGSDTCLQIGGQVRADYYYSALPSEEPKKRNLDQTVFRTNARVRFDARTQTDYGLLRSFFELQAEAKAGISTFAVRQAYLQFGGLTAGFAWSPYAFFDPKYADIYFAPYFGEQGRRDLISYTAQFGKAFATVSVEDNRDHRAANSFGNGGLQGGSVVPDLVGVLGYDDQKTGWGRFQVMGALHQNRSSDAAFGSEWGYSIGAGGNVNFPVLAGAYVAAEGSYSEGALKYLGVGNSQPASSSILGFGAADAYPTRGAPYDLTRAKGWAVQAEAGLNITKPLQLVLFGGYLNYDAPDIATKNSDNFSYYVVGGQVNYTVVKGFIAGAEVWYQNKDQEGISDNIDSIGAGVRLRRTF